MAIKLFILGLPGSGKSTTYRYIDSYIKKQYKGRAVIRTKDYTFLSRKCEADTEGRRFRRLHPNGFDILDFTVLDEVLDELAMEANNLIEVAQESDIVVIEFSRNDYRKALEQFKTVFLRDAYFLFLEANIDICKQRISNRVDNWETNDDHYVSDDIIDSYYRKENWQSFSSNLNTRFGIVDKHIQIIVNNGLATDIHEEINHFIDSILRQTGNYKKAT